VEKEQQSEQAKEDKKAVEDAAKAWVRSHYTHPVERRWVKPPSAESGLSCKIQITLLAGGVVTNAHVVKSSGDEDFDRSAEAAVIKASPLPWPDDPKIAQVLRSEPVTITFTPKD
jgi:colicin import membrane protein